MYLLTGFTLASLLQLLLAPWGWGTPGMIIPSLAFLMALGTLALAMRRLHPCPSAWPLWLAAFLASVCMASWVHLKTCLTQKISWRGKIYQVDWRGRVSSIRQ